MIDWQARLDVQVRQSRLSVGATAPERSKEAGRKGKAAGSREGRAQGKRAARFGCRDCSPPAFVATVRYVRPAATASGDRLRLRCENGLPLHDCLRFWSTLMAAGCTWRVNDHAEGSENAPYPSTITRSAASSRGPEDRSRIADTARPQGGSEWRQGASVVIHSG